MTFPKRLRSNESGATAIEYGLLAAVIGMTISTTVANLGFVTAFASLRTISNALFQSNFGFAI